MNAITREKVIEIIARGLVRVLDPDPRAARGSPEEQANIDARWHDFVLEAEYALNEIEAHRFVVAPLHATAEMLNAGKGGTDLTEAYALMIKARPGADWDWSLGGPDAPKGGAE